MISELLIRPGRPDDRPAVARICAQTWDWGDYVPEVWDDWLADRVGVALVGEWAGQVVALSKVTFLTSDQVWLEGMRVAPDYRQRGIAERFLKHSLEYACQRGAGVVRLGTSHRNEPVLRMVARAGMTRVACYQIWSAEPNPDGPQPRLLTIEHAAMVRSFLSQDLQWGQLSPLYSIDWTWEELSSERTDAFLEAGQVAARFGSLGELSALGLFLFEPEDQVLWLAWTHGEANMVRALAEDARRHAADMGAQKVRAMVPDRTGQRAAFGDAGYDPEDRQGELWIFERWLGGSRDSDRREG